MIALALEFCVVVGWFIWLYRRQIRDRERQRRVPLRQLPLPLEQQDREA
ncbi:hypothetical protein [Chthoniobacter flavus]|nr:hypothetical protein [Chthoniobacter flavus]